jgi:hypothetical protein
MKIIIIINYTIGSGASSCWHMSHGTPMSRE